MIMDNDQTGLVNLEEFVSGGRWSWLSCLIQAEHLFISYHFEQQAGANDTKKCLALTAAGCLQGRGPAKSIQLVKMSYENKVTRQALKKVGVELRRVTTDLSDFRKRMGLHPTILSQSGADSF